MPAPVFIGDALSAAAYRLAGVSALSAEPGATRALLEQARQHAELILLSAEYAAELERGERARIQAWERPLVLIVPDIRNRHPVVDLASDFGMRLGLSA